MTQLGWVRVLVGQEMARVDTILQIISTERSIFAGASNITA